MWQITELDTLVAHTFEILSAMRTISMIAFGKIFAYAATVSLI